MDGFSVASVTSLCTSISNRSAASIGDLQNLIKTPPSTEAFTKLNHLLASFTGLNHHVTQTETALNAAQAISDQLQQVLKEYLTSCDGAVGAVGKQLMRLQEDNIHLVDWSVVETYRFTLTTYTNLFTFLVTLLQTDQREAQDASLTTARGVVAQAENLSRMVSNANSILKDQPEATATETTAASSSKEPVAIATENAADGEGNDEPPPYEAAPSASQAGPSPQAGPSSQAEAGPSSSSGGFSFSMITDSLKAVASSLSSKPEPLVSALCQAAGQADLQQVKGLLSQGANINGRNEDGNNALQCAILANRVDMVRFLLDAGAGLKGWSSAPPLFFAAAAGSIDVAKVILERDNNVRAKDMSGQPYFSNVVSKQNVEGVKFLLENGANASATDVSGQPMLAKAVSKSNIELATLLLDYGASPNTKSNSGSSMLSNAAGKEDYAMANLLLDRGANPNSKSVSGTTALSDALGRRRVAFAKALLARGANGNTKDNSGEHALMKVIRDTKMEEQDRVDLVWLLLENGAPATASDSLWSVPALCHAVERGNADITALLLQYGAKVTSRMSNEKLPLVHAIDQRRADLVRILLWHGADVNKKDGDKRTAMTAATAKQDSEILQLLDYYNEASHRSPGNAQGVIQKPATVESLKTQRPSQHPAYYVGSQTQGASQGSPRPRSPPPGYE